MHNSTEHWLLSMTYIDVDVWEDCNPAKVLEDVKDF